MIESGTKDLVRRWLSKADIYSDEILENSFDKFFSLYVAYNALYFEGTKYLKSKGIKIEGDWDKVSATKNIPIYIGQKELYEELVQYRNDIERIIKPTGFYFSTKKNKDEELIEKIRDSFNETEIEKQQEFNIALLELIYYVRCNMFHGKKEFDENQRDFLNSVNKILEMIVRYILDNK